jgi:hypothetical protein
MKMIDTLINFFQQNGVPVFGIAESGRLEDADVGHRASDMLKDVSSILCFGIPVPKGLFQSRNRWNQNYWRIASIYYQRLDLISSRTAVSLESEGHSALPVLS